MILKIWTEGPYIKVSVESPDDPQGPFRPAFRIDRQKAGLLHSVLTRAENSKEYSARLECDGTGKVRFSEELKRDLV